MALDLLKRSEKGTELSFGEVDANWTAIEVALNAIDAEKLFKPSTYYSSTHLGDYKIAIQSAIDAAGYYPASNKAARVFLDDFYPCSGGLLIRPYVSIFGVGHARSGITSLSSHTAGPMFDADVVAGTSSLQYASLKNFGIYGTSASGSAYAIRMRGQKHGLLEEMLIYNFANTSEAAVQFLGTCQAMAMKRVHFLSNAYHEKIASTAANVFPTTIQHSGIMYDSGSVNTGAAVEIIDANACTWDETCIAQNNGNLDTFRITGSVNRSTAHSHVFDGVYVESNGGGQANACNWNLTGVSANKVDNVHILRPRIHGLTGPSGRHVRAQWTEYLTILGADIDHAFLTDLGNNTKYNIDATGITGACDLNSPKYNTSKCVFNSVGTVSYQEGPVTFSVARQNVGIWDVTLSRGMSSEMLHPYPQDTVEVGAIHAYSLKTSNTVHRVYCRNGANTAYIDPGQIKLTISGIYA